MAITFDQYYADNFERWVNLLAKRIRDRNEAEDRVQDIFTSLIPRKDFCEGLIERGAFDKYIQSAIGRQRAQIYREECRRPPTVSIDSDNIDFLSSIRDIQHGGEVTDEVELNSFYEAAVKCLGGGRKLSGGCFETVGELRQYIFVHHCRNGRTFQEIGELVELSHQNISTHFARIVTILTPMIEAFTGKKLKALGNDLNISGDIPMV